MKYFFFDLQKKSIVKKLGESCLQDIINFCLHYIANLEIPKKRGHFIEYRQGMLNISPIGRDCCYTDRCKFEEWDNTSLCRKNFVNAIRKNFPELDDVITLSIGGQISFDLFPTVIFFETKILGVG